MFRKLALAATATVALGAAAIAPSAAFAFGGHWGHFGHHWHGGFGIYAPIVVGGSDCYIVRRVVDTPVGPRVRRMEICG